MVSSVSYLIGTSEHSMIGKFIDQIIPEQSLPQTLTSYSPCFRKEKEVTFLGPLYVRTIQQQKFQILVQPITCIY